MDIPKRYKIVRIKTIDGISLEACHYEPESTRAATIVMSHGFNCVKEMSLGETAESFQSAGFNVLLYDARGVGGSDGLPRNQIDPVKMVEDVSDVISFATTLPNANPGRILLWGMSFGATISGVAATVDRRVSAVMMVCPLFSYIREDRRITLFAQLMQERRSQLKGNEPFYVPPFNTKGENPAGFAGAGGLGGREAYAVMKGAVERGHPNFRDRITFQTYYKLALFRPKELLADMLENIPTMMIIPELDNMSPPAEQRAVFDSLKTPKQLHFAAGKGHLSILDGHGSTTLRSTMVEFFTSTLEDQD
ncbi:alpha/beta-hydrolase [Daldinia bambusicola]|nr:alpha/beta-hydrolase [Daldinia bambusicola]